MASLRWRHLRVTCALALASWSCAVGPDFVRPEPPMTTDYTPGPPPKLLSPGAADVEPMIRVLEHVLEG